LETIAAKHQLMLWWYDVSLHLIGTIAVHSL